MGYMNIGKIIRSARINAGYTMKTVESMTKIPASNQSKIELGDNKHPGFFTIAKMADLYDISLDSIYSALKAGINIDLKSNRLQTFNHVPILNWEEIPRWNEVIKNSDEHTGSAVCPFPCTKNTFALKVYEDSMTNTIIGGKTFPIGSTIFVDTEVEAKHGDFVVASKEEGKSATFKQLIIDSDEQYLKPLNTQYHISEPVKNLKTYGVVLGMIMKT